MAGFVLDTATDLIQYPDPLLFCRRSIQLLSVLFSGGGQKTLHWNGVEEVWRERGQDDVFSLRTDRGVPDPPRT